MFKLGDLGSKVLINNYTKTADVNGDYLRQTEPGDHSPTGKLVLKLPSHKLYSIFTEIRGLFCMTEKKWSDGDLDMHRTVKEKKGVKS